MEKSKEIDILAIVIQSLKKFKTLSIIVGSFTIIGIIVAFCTPKSYTATVVLAPEMSGGSLNINNDLADMASNFGIDINSASKGMDAIYPEIYPEIFASNDFAYKLFNIKIRTSKDSIRTYKEHLLKDTKVPFWQKATLYITNLLKKEEQGKGKITQSDSYKLSKNDYGLCEGITKSISCTIDKKTSVITISFIDQDPLTAAIVADTLQKRLQNYITMYRTKKARLDYQYYTKLYKEALKKYNKAQKTYASFCDANQDVALQSFISKRDELENDMQISFNTMSQLRTQVETCSAKIQERTPAFTIISKPEMPYKASSRPRAYTVIIFMLLGYIIDLVWIYYNQEKRKKVKEK